MHLLHLHSLLQAADGIDIFLSPPPASFSAAFRYLLLLAFCGAANLNHNAPANFLNRSWLIHPLLGLNYVEEWHIFLLTT